MKSFNVTEYTIADIVRSGFIRVFNRKDKLGLGMEHNGYSKTKEQLAIDEE